MASIKGVDFCHWQGNVNFEKLANNNVRFAIFKAGEVPTTSRQEFTDDKYQRNIAEAKKNNIISGAYYFFHPAIGAARQARHFDTVMKSFGVPDLPPVIDVESEDNREPDFIAAEIKAMSDALVSRGYRTPIIYSRWGFLVNKVGEPFWIKDHLLWLAQYSNQLVNKPADMRNVVMWQYSDRLKIPGIGAALDGNYWLKSEEELLQLGKRPAPVVVEIPAPQTVESQPQVQEEQSWPDKEEIIPTQTEQPSQAVETAPAEETLSQDLPAYPAQEIQQPQESTASSTVGAPSTQISQTPELISSKPRRSLGFWEAIIKLIQAIFKRE